MTKPISTHKPLAIMLLVIFIVIGAYLSHTIFFSVSSPNEKYELVINKNETIMTLANELKNAHIINNASLFRWLLRLLHRDKKVLAGLYIIKMPASMWQLLWRITNGKPDQISVTIIDGVTFAQLRKSIDQLNNIRHFTTNMTNEEIKNVLHIPYSSLEGLFYPSTYFVAPYQSDLDIYRLAYGLMQAKLHSLFAISNDNRAYTNAYQMLILASLIQKETSDPNDMQLIATVFNNRLHKGMKLQDDPAVFYGLRDYKLAAITRKQFRIDTPYNTYLHNGLPPTPICLPSLNALMAASSPLNKPNLYFFVAIGDGKTLFSSNYNNHLTLVSKYIKPKHLHVHEYNNHINSTNNTNIRK